MQYLWLIIGLVGVGIVILALILAMTLPSAVDVATSPPGLNPPGLNITSPPASPNSAVSSVRVRREPLSLDQATYDGLVAKAETSPFNTARSKFKTEGFCCNLLEHIYGKPFGTVRLSYMKNPETGRALEFDCYNDELKIAVEYEGYQHYVFPNRFHRTREEFDGQIRRDNYKWHLAEEHGIYTIFVPNLTDKREIRDYLWSRLPENVHDTPHFESISCEL